MTTIKVRSIRFTEIPFRKLKSMTVPLADRLTIIAGHNGIGKSTILGLLANASGLSDASNLSYFDRAFQANLQDIIHLSLEHDFVDEPDQKPNVFIEYSVGSTNLTKRCNVTKHSMRFRMVPRNEPKEDFSHKSLQIPVDNKVPLPTIYLGMSRMIPVGESAPSDVQRAVDLNVQAIDRDYIHALIHNLIDTGTEQSEAITQQSIKRTKKSSKHPDYPYDSRSVSLGQDSLSAVVTALASFKKLKRDMGRNYVGGLLIIDEIDAGFHPRTQRDLVRMLQREANSLDLQVLATTHSLVIIEKMLSDSENIKAGIPQLDYLHYLQDTRRPHLCDDWTLDDIREDMYLDADLQPSKKAKPTIVVYTEDDEAKIIFDHVVKGADKARVTREAGVKTKCLSIKMGCDDLMKLYKADKYFETVAIVLDADASTGKVGDKANIVKLPGTAPAGKRPTPEFILYKFIQSLVANPDDHASAWNKLRSLRCSSDHLHTNILAPAVQIEKRDAAKEWFNAKLSAIKRWQLIDLWLEENAAAKDTFLNEFIAAVKAAQRRKTQLANLAKP